MRAVRVRHFLAEDGFVADRHAIPPRRVGSAGSDRALPQAERPKKLAQNVARAILQWVTDNNMPAGTALPPEADLLEIFGVGRSSLREALRILENHGLVEVRTGRHGGPVVASASTDDIAQTIAMYLHASGVSLQSVIESRITLEPALARLAATRSDDAEVRDHMLSFTRRDNGASARVQAVPYRPNPNDFHWSIAEASGNDVLRLLGHSMRAVYSHAAQDVQLSNQESARIAKAHVVIARAVIDGDLVAAESHMRLHLEEVLKLLEHRYLYLLERRIAWP